jgi:transglutaminase-like putative cysteine protease
MSVGAVEIVQIPSGWRGTERTVQEMIKLVHPRKRNWDWIQLATAVALQNSPGKNLLRQADNIFRYCKAKIAYIKDPYKVEMIEAPYRVLQRRAGDCDSSSVLVGILNEAVGIPAAFKAIKSDPTRPEEFSHVYTMVFIPGRGWLGADISTERSYLGWEPETYWGGQLWKITD